MFCVGEGEGDSLSKTEPDCWREKGLWLLVILVLGIFFTQIQHPPLRGEETRRAMVGVNMIRSGDWIVPTELENPFFTSCRPPLQSWTIAGIGLLKGGVDVWAIRLPSVCALLLVVLIIYIYCRSFIGQLGAFAAGAAYLSCGQILELGRVGETDLMFTFFVAGALLLWHMGYVRGWPAVATWSIGYFMAAMGTMTKGPQAPVYFIGSIAAYLLITRDWRYALSRAHLAGIFVYAVVVGAWLIPYSHALGLPGVKHVFFGDVITYFDNWTLRNVVMHYLGYPLSILVSILPWSLLLLAYAHRGVRESIGSAWRLVLFQLVCLAVCFPTVWFISGSKPRFFMSLYPSIAILIGVVADRCGAAQPGSKLQSLWLRFAAFCGIAMVVAGVGLPIVRWKMASSLSSEVSVSLTLTVAAASVLTGIIVLAGNRKQWSGHCFVALFCITASLGLLYTGFAVRVMTALSSRADLAVAELKKELPEDCALYALGYVPHLFIFHYGKPVSVLPIPARCEMPPERVEYFCTSKSICFPYERIAKISCNRRKNQSPPNDVIVGRIRSEDREAFRRTEDGGRKTE
jgi:4-amino-4-deoxy-L-arabinose transferase-like glycosyltransferase